MAKKKKSSSKAKAAARAKQTQVKVTAKTTVAEPTQIESVPVETAKKVAKPKVTKLVKVAPAAAPKIPVATKKWRPSPLERLAMVLGGVLLVIGVVGMLQQQPTHDTVSNDVKKQQIPMSLDDFKDDPAIQQAIQKQLGGSGTAPNPQEQGQTGQSGNKASEALQSPAGNLQSQ